MDKQEIDAAREAFFGQGAGNAQRKEPEPSTDRPDATSRASEIAQRNAGLGKQTVELMTDIAHGRAYRQWAEQDYEALRAIREPEHRETAIQLIADNARDPLYADELRHLDMKLARDVAERNQSLEQSGQAAASVESPKSDVERPPVVTDAQAPRAANDARAPLQDRPVANDDRNAPSTAAPANDARLPVHERSVANDERHAPEVVISDETAAKLAARRIRETEAARAALASNPVRSVRQQPDAGSNSIAPVQVREQQAPSEQLDMRDPSADASTDMKAFEIPAAIARRYVVQDGKYWQFDGADRTLGLTGDPHFQDHGARLSTPSDDRNTIADMVTIAQAKGWQEVSLNGSEDFRRAAWIEANLAGIQVKGFEPTERDTAMLEAARREHDALKISAGKPVAAPVNAQTPAPVEQANEVTREAAAVNTPAPASRSGPADASAQRAAPNMIPVAELRKQMEEVVADLPENVRREVMDRFAERLDAGLKVQQLHERNGNSPAELGKALDARIEGVDRARVARNTPAVKPATPARELGRGSRQEGPELH